MLNLSGTPTRWSRTLAQLQEGAQEGSTFQETVGQVQHKEGGQQCQVTGLNTKPENDKTAAGGAGFEYKLEKILITPIRSYQNLFIRIFYHNFFVKENKE